MYWSYVDHSNFKPCKEKVLDKIKEKMIELKQKIKPRKTKAVLNESGIKKYLNKLHWKFVTVTIDKKSRNFAFICRKYYISKLIAKVSANKNKNSTSTCSQIQNYKDELI